MIKTAPQPTAIAAVMCRFPTYSHRMVLTIPTGRTPHELVEVAPTHCASGHPLGPRQVIVYGVRPDGVRARSWTCRECGVITLDE